MEVQPLIRLDGGQEALLESWILEPFESRTVDHDDPQSGGSMGRVYDLDSPGVRLLPSAGILEKRRQRLNALQWAVLDNLGTAQK